MNDSTARENAGARPAASTGSDGKRRNDRRGARNALTTGGRDTADRKGPRMNYRTEVHKT